MSTGLSKRRSAAIDSIVADVMCRLLTLAVIAALLLFTVLPPYVPAILAGLLFQILALRATKKSLAYSPLHAQPPVGFLLIAGGAASLPARRSQTHLPLRRKHVDVRPGARSSP